MKLSAEVGDVECSSLMGSKLCVKLMREHLFGAGTRAQARAHGRSKIFFVRVHGRSCDYVGRLGLVLKGPICTL